MTIIDIHESIAIKAPEEKLVDSIAQSVSISATRASFSYGIFEVEQLDVNLVAKKFFSKASQDTDILPPVTRWVSRDMTHIMVERPPFVVTVKYVDIHGDHAEESDRCDDCYSDDHDECHCGWEDENRQLFRAEYTLNIPWTVWFFELDKDLVNIVSCQAYSRPTMVTSMDDMLYSLPLPNLYEDAKICWGDVLYHMPRTSYASLGAYLLDAINGFWTGWFNNDLIYLTADIVLPYEASGRCETADSYLCEWSKMSMEDVMSENFSREVTTVGQQCNSLKAYWNAQQVTVNKNTLSRFFKEIVS